MSQYELDLNIAKSIIKILDATVSGTLDDNVNFNIRKGVNPEPNLEKDWICIRSKYCMIEYCMTSRYNNNMLWSTQLQIESEPESNMLYLSKTKQSFELIINPEDEATYFQNSLIYEPYIHSMLFLASYIKKHINKHNIKSVNVIFGVDVSEFIDVAKVIGE